MNQSGINLIPSSQDLTSTHSFPEKILFLFLPLPARTIRFSILGGLSQSVVSNRRSRFEAKMEFLSNSYYRMKGNFFRHLFTVLPYLLVTSTRPSNVCWVWDVWCVVRTCVRKEIARDIRHNSARSSLVKAMMESKYRKVVTYCTFNYLPMRRNICPLC